MHSDNNDFSVMSAFIATISALDEPWGIKDIHSRHIYMNDAARKYTHIPPKFDIEGKLDSECPASWSEMAEEFTQHDRLTEIANERVAVIETDFWYGMDELHPYVSEKMPLRDQNHKCIGTLWNAKKIKVICPMVCIGDKKPGVLQTSSELDMFTKPEMDLIFFLLKRLSRKEIGKILGAAMPTVRNRIGEIYNKADVHNQIQFEEFCRHHNLENYLPHTLLNRGVRFI
ncbi:helix-turn-helix transcriptional regulator [Pantoea ananatis]|uniref:helix-turn-helix transcriptional regulator n=1 Tax=Pantoea ananas TaxID=553 RepID=UPI001B3080FE|nr:LuxR family transcriptional regulator [Pantoea ananatis]